LWSWAGSKHRRVIVNIAEEFRRGEDAARRRKWRVPAGQFKVAQQLIHAVSLAAPADLDGHADPAGSRGTPAQPESHHPADLRTRRGKSAHSYGRATMNNHALLLDLVPPRGLQPDLPHI
jgi:hypothetical protein